MSHINLILWGSALPAAILVALLATSPLRALGFVLAGGVFALVTQALTEGTLSNVTLWIGYGFVLAGLAVAGLLFFVPGAGLAMRITSAVLVTSVAAAVANYILYIVMLS